MEFNASQFKAPERQLDDTIQVQEGVVDKSKAVETQGLAEAVSGASSVFDVSQNIMAGQKKSANASAANQYLAHLEQEEAKTGQGIDPLIIDAERTKLQSQLISSGAISSEELLDLEIKFGRVQDTRKTPQEKWEEETDALAWKAGLVPENATPEQREEARKTYLEAKSIQFQYEKNKAQNTEDAYLHFKNLSKTMLPAAYNKGDAALKHFSETGDRATTENMIRRAKGEFVSAAHSIAIGSAIKPGEVDAIIKPTTDYYDDLLSNYSQKGFATFLENRKKTLLTQTELTLLTKYPNLRNVAAIKGVVGDQMAATAATNTIISDVVADFSEAGKNNTNPQMNVVNASEGSKHYFENVLPTALMNPDLPMEDKQPQAAGATKAIGQQLSDFTDISDAKATMEFLAGKGGKWLVENKELINPEDLDRMRDSVTRHSVEVFQKFSAELADVKPIVRNTRGGGEGGIFLEVVGERVMFTGDTPHSSRKARSLNQKLSKPLTVYVTALATVSGASLQEELDVRADDIWPQRIARGDVEQMQEFDQTGVAQGTGFEEDSGDITVDKDLGEFTMKETGDEEYDSRIKDLVQTIDSVNDPSLSYILKRKLADLNNPAGRVRSNAGDRTGRARRLAEQRTSGTTIGDRMFEEVAASEGSGDRVTSVPTAHFGVTAKAAEAVGESFDVDMSEEEAREISIKYLNHLDGKFSEKVPSWNSLNEDIKQFAIDTAYNIGPEVLNWKGLMGDLKSKAAPDELAKNILDSAKSEGKLMKGLALRRARAYNKIATTPIVYVEQDEDGTITYLDAEENVIFTYNIKAGRHPDSAPGRASV